MKWDTIDEFLATMERWKRIQQHLEAVEAQRLSCADHGLVQFETPILEGDNLLLPNGSAGGNDIDGVEELYVSIDSGGYTLRSNGYARGDSWKGTRIANFSHFELAGKFILSYYDSRFRPTIGLPPILERWVGSAPQTGWAIATIPPAAENNFDTTRFIKSGNPDMSFVGEPYQALFTYPLSMTYQELTDTVMEGVPQPD